MLSFSTITVLPMCSCVIFPPFVRVLRCVRTRYKNGKKAKIIKNVKRGFRERQRFGTYREEKKITDRDEIRRRGSGNGDGNIKVRKTKEQMDSDTKVLVE